MQRTIYTLYCLKMASLHTDSTYNSPFDFTAHQQILPKMFSLNYVMLKFTNPLRLFCMDLLLFATLLSTLTSRKCWVSFRSRQWSRWSCCHRFHSWCATLRRLILRIFLAYRVFGTTLEFAEAEEAGGSPSRRVDAESHRWGVIMHFWGIAKHAQIFLTAHLFVALYFAGYSSDQSFLSEVGPGQWTRVSISSWAMLYLRFTNTDFNLYLLFVSL